MQKVSTGRNQKFIRAFVLMLLFSVTVSAQQNQKDTVSTSNKRANKAALMSAILPGLGQAYNKKYWKIPVIYGGAAVLTYFVVENNSQYHTYKNAYINRTDGDSSTIDEFPTFSDDDLTVRIDYYRRNRDLSYILLGVLYTLNIIDAYVDAHLKEFDVSDNLSLRTSPWINPSYNGKQVAGLTFTFTLH